MKHQLSDRIAKIVVVIWYLVGIAGFMTAPLQPLFQQLTPFGIIGAVVLLMYFHEPVNLKNWLVFSGIAIVGFTVELIGVNTQILFGFYRIRHLLSGSTG